MPKISKILENILSKLSEKQKEVIVGRFGLDKHGKEKTLAAVGVKLRLTRERVRQIEKTALGLIGKHVAKDADSSHLVALVKSVIEKAGGAIREDELIAGLGSAEGDIRSNHLNLLAEATGSFHFSRETDKLRPFYYLKKEDENNAVGFIDAWEKHLNRNKEKILSGEYEKQLADFIKPRRIKAEIAENFLRISKMIHKNVYGDIGLAAWPEIKPVTARDLSYLILKKKNKPLHFEELTKEINAIGISSRLALAPTVHNELIKDERFVLVGRGVYGLREHGYEPGFARDVIKRILKKHGPLRSEQIIEHVNRERVLRPNTIIVNLQKGAHFERLSDGRYRVREA